MPNDDEWVCGVDEAGRGPLAGSVVAAAVILDPNKPIDGLRDSKKLSAKVRDELFDIIIRDSKAWCIAEASAAEIDSINILQATMLAMKRAIEGLEKTLGRLPDKALIDGNRCPSLPIPARAIVQASRVFQAWTAAAAQSAAVLYGDKHKARYDGNGAHHCKARSRARNKARACDQPTKVSRQSSPHSDHAVLLHA